MKQLRLAKSSSRALQTVCKKLESGSSDCLTCASPAYIGDLLFPSVDFDAGSVPSTILMCGDHYDSELPKLLAHAQHAIVASPVVEPPLLQPNSDPA